MPATVSNKVVWTTAGTTSDATDLQLTDKGAEIVGFIMPATFTGTSITFQVSSDDSTYQALQDDTDTAVSVTVTQGKTYGLKQDKRAALGRWRFIKIVSNASEAATRTIEVVTRQ